MRTGPITYGVPEEKGLSNTFLYAVAGLSLVALLSTLSAAVSSIETIQGLTAQQKGYEQQLATIEKRSAIKEAEYKAFASEGDGMSVQGYRCDPFIEPTIEKPEYWAQAEPRAVYDGYSTLTGYVNPDGTYNHLGYCH